MLMTTDQKQQKSSKSDITRAWWRVMSPFNDFCCVWSVIVNIMQ